MFRAKPGDSGRAEVIDESRRAFLESLGKTRKRVKYRLPRKVSFGIH
jgi:hypothetical protein